MKADFKMNPPTVSFHQNGNFIFTENLKEGQTYYPSVLIWEINQGATFIQD